MGKRRKKVSDGSALPLSYTRYNNSVGDEIFGQLLQACGIIKPQHHPPNMSFLAQFCVPS